MLAAYALTGFCVGALVEAERFLFFDNYAGDGVPAGIHQRLRPLRFVAAEGLRLGCIDTGPRHNAAAPSISRCLGISPSKWWLSTCDSGLMGRTGILPRMNGRTGRG